MNALGLAPGEPTSEYISELTLKASATDRKKITRGTAKTTTSVAHYRSNPNP
jgi:hypothetical protein